MNIPSLEQKACSLQNSKEECLKARKVVLSATRAGFGIAPCEICPPGSQFEREVAATRERVCYICRVTKIYPNVLSDACGPCSRAVYKRRKLKQGALNGRKGGLKRAENYARAEKTSKKSPKGRKVFGPYKRRKSNAEDA